MRFLANLLGSVTKLAIIVLAIGGIGYFAYMCWGNSQEIAFCREVVLERLNKQLVQKGMVEDRELHFPNASVWLGVPQVLEFSRAINRNEGSFDRQFCGTLNGTFDRMTGQLKVDFVYQDGSKDQIDETLGSGG
ncbi:MAG: hypothetical protein ACOY3P_16855 [Planctomycetota bacterium]